jgi:hypothetical protein
MDASYVSPAFTRSIIKVRVCFERKKATSDTGQSTCTTPIETTGVNLRVTSSADIYGCENTDPPCHQKLLSLHFFLGECKPIVCLLIFYLVLNTVSRDAYLCSRALTVVSHTVLLEDK